VAAAGLYTVVSVRNGPGRNALMPDVTDEDVITTLYVNQGAQAAYREMLQDVVSRFKDCPGSLPGSHSSSRRLTFI